MSRAIRPRCLSLSLFVHKLFNDNNLFYTESKIYKPLRLLEFKEVIYGRSHVHYFINRQK